LAERACLADTSIERDVGAQRASGNDLARVCGLAVAARLEVRGVDVPRIELDGPVLVELEPVPRRRQRLAARRLVDDAHDAPVRREYDAKETVLQRQPLDANLVIRRDLDGVAVRRRLDEHGVDDLAARDTDRVHERVTVADQLMQRRLELREVATRVVVDEPDRRAGKDVVELLQEEELPEPVELGAWIVAARGAEELCVVQELLADAVAALDERLRREDAAVVLEVELADDDRTLGVLGLECGEELVARRASHPRQAFEVSHTAQALEHRARGPAAAVTEAVDEQARAARVVVFELAPREQHLVDADVAVVVVGGRVVREHLASVDALPDERVRVRPVEAVPRKLLCEKPRDSAQAQQLRQL